MALVKTKTLSKLNQERLEMLNGCEVQSKKHEGCVGIHRDNLYMDGGSIDKLDTNRKVSYLWRAYVRQEGF